MLEAFPSIEIFWQCTPTFLWSFDTLDVLVPVPELSAVSADIVLDRENLIRGKLRRRSSNRRVPSLSSVMNDQSQLFTVSWLYRKCIFHAHCSCKWSRKELKRHYYHECQIKSFKLLENCTNISDHTSCTSEAKEILFHSHQNLKTWSIWLI